MTFERKILTKTFGLAKEDNQWRIRTKAERDKLFMDVEIGAFIRTQCRRWLGRMMPETPRKYSKKRYTRNNLRKDPSLDVKMMWRMT
jgi:hypothetical protein